MSCLIKLLSRLNLNALPELQPVYSTIKYNLGIMLCHSLPNPSLRCILSIIVLSIFTGGPYNAIQEFPSKLGNIFIDVVPQDPYYHGWSSYGHYIELQAK